ncbi:MAG: dihydrolipoamide acetyltransferase family protein [Terriglobia bacterium]
MARAVAMPKLGQSEDVGTILKWRKKEGDAVSKGDILFEIETDKAILEVESFFDGTLLKILVQEGQTVPVQTTVGYIGQPGESAPETTPAPTTAAALASTAASGEHARPPAPAAREEPTASQTLPASLLLQPSVESSSAAAAQKISPRAARLAREHGVDPKHIQGTGPNGRIVERDVKAFLTARGYDRLRITPAARKLALKENLDLLTLRDEVESRRVTVEDVRSALAERPKPLTRMRQAIADQLTRSFTTTPHFFTTVSVDMTALEAYRAQLKTAGSDYTVTDFLVKSAAQALKEFPVVNSTTDGKRISWHSRIHLGLAVALDEGLMVVVIRDADRMDLAEIHDRAAELVTKAHAGKLTPNEMTGGTFTISNMGMLDVENFTAIINPGESAILAVSSIVKKPVVVEDELTIRSMMKVTLSADHRLIDGATAAKFVNAFKQKLEEISWWKRFV